MCVIMLVSKTRPTTEMVEKAWEGNPHGAGIAYRERDEVVWEKGIMELPRIMELCRTAPLPYVVHFRVASVGGVKPSLTHPFLVSPDAKLDLTGRTKGAVLFHNGHWNSWNDKALDAAIHSNNRVPEGSDWSDSRAMAWMVYIYGPGFMELLTQQKGVLMTPKKFNIFTGNGWEKINDVWCSNDYFWHKGYTNHYNRGGAGYYKLCSRGKCTNRCQGGRDICDACDKEIREKKVALESGINGKASEGNEIGIVTGGASRPLAKMFSIAEVEGFYKNAMISKSLLKKYRKAHGSSQDKGNRGARAIKQMQDLSQDIAEVLIQAG